MKSLLLIALLFCSLAACNRASQDKEAIRQAVIEHISGKVNVAAMDVDVTAVTFKGQEADATVSFRVKGAGSGTPMEMPYTLEQKGGKWIVKSNPGAASAHGAIGDPGVSAMPPGHPPLDSGEAKK